MNSLRALIWLRETQFAVIGIRLTAHVFIAEVKLSRFEYIDLAKPVQYGGYHTQIFFFLSDWHSIEDVDVAFIGGRLPRCGHLARGDHALFSRRVRPRPGS